MDINFLEILFIINIVAILIVWLWFVILGFRANKAWGFSMIFLPPIVPFMFAARFARKARKAIYYHGISWVLLVAFIGYIQFTSVDFYKSFLLKIAPNIPIIFVNEPSVDEPKKEPLVTSKDTTIVDEQVIELEIIEGSVDEESVITEPVEVKIKKRRYKVVNMNDMRSYVGKNVIVTTSTKKHRGRLSSASPSVLVIKKRLPGGSASLPIKKSKIKKVEVYLR